MGAKRSTICAILLLFGISSFAQLPPKTVVFKVRKAKGSNLVSIVVIQEKKDELIVERKPDDQVFQVVEESATF